MPASPAPGAGLNDAVISSLAVLGVMAQAALAVLLLVALLRAVGVEGPWRAVRETLHGSGLWLAFAVALVGTAGSLFYSEAAGFIPCKLCWFQRISMYPLVLLALPAFRNDRRAAQYLLPLPVIGLGISVWHILVERGIVADTQSCSISAPGGCATRWIEELGYSTIPTMAATGFAAIIVLLAFSAFDTARRA